MSRDLCKTPIGDFPGVARARIILQRNWPVPLKVKIQFKLNTVKIQFKLHKVKIQFTDVYCNTVILLLF